MSARQTPPIALLPSPSTAPSLRPPPPPGAPARSPTRGLPIAHPHGPQPAPDPAAGKGDPGAPAPSPTLVLPTALTHPQRGLVPGQPLPQDPPARPLPHRRGRGARAAGVCGHAAVVAGAHGVVIGFPPEWDGARVCVCTRHSMGSPQADPTVLASHTAVQRKHR